MPPAELVIASARSAQGVIWAPRDALDEISLGRRLREPETPKKNQCMEDSVAKRAIDVHCPREAMADYIAKMIHGDQMRVLLDFREWVRSLPG